MTEGKSRKFRRDFGKGVELKKRNGKGKKSKEKKMRKDTLVLMLLLLLALSGCSGPKPEQRTSKTSKEVRQQAQQQVKEEKLWEYLDTFRDSSKMPATKEIEKRFGKPNEDMPWEENPSAYYGPSRESYYRFVAAEKQLKSLPVVAWRYYYQGDKNRWIDVVVRKSEGTIVGWSWFENVPPGQESGPPD